MYAQGNKSKKNNNKTIVNSVEKNGNKSIGANFVDNRPENFTQKNLINKNVQTPVQKQKNKKKTASNPPMQLLYLKNKEKEQKKPEWTDTKNPPDDYLQQGTYDDGTHGKDSLYVKPGNQDLFYGLSFEDNKNYKIFLETLCDLAKGEKNLHNPKTLRKAYKDYQKYDTTYKLDVESHKILYGGSSGWDKYTAYTDNSQEVDTFLKLNKSITLAQDTTSKACQYAMLKSILLNGSVMFLLDGMENISGIMSGKEYINKITTKELRFIYFLLDKTLKVPVNSNDDKSKEITPKEGVNVFFYLDQKLVKINDYL